VSQGPDEPRADLESRRVLETWWPLAGSWLLMAAELPLVSAVVARLPDPTVHLAAIGGIVFPLALLVESPIIMLLAASTALSRDRTSYLRLLRFTNGAGLVLTLCHVVLAFTPAYDLVVERLLHAPPEIREPARLGLRLLVPWTWAIAHRRFHQGVLIRHGRSRAVGMGTGVRLLANSLVLFGGFLAGELPGTAVAAAALSTGVLSEAAYVRLRVRPVLRGELRHPVPSEPALTRLGFLRFYVPLAMTSLLNLLMEPIGAAAIGRMPRALDSLAIWPVISGFVFMVMSLGVAFNEVVVALLGQPGARRVLRRFALGLAAFSILPLLVPALCPPVASLLLETVTGLPRHLATLAQRGLWFALPLPGLAVVQSWYQGNLVYSRRTRGIPESLGLFLLTASAVAFTGVLWGGAPGLFVGLAALVTGGGVQALWLRRRCHRAWREEALRPAA